MRRSIITVLLLLMSTAIFAQRPENRVYMAGGFNYQLATAPPLDYIIERYNDTRGYLTQDMEKLGHMSGATFSFGFGMGEDVDFLLFELGLTLGGSGALKSEGPVNGVQQTRDVKVSAYYINTGFAYLIQTEQKFEYGIGMFIDYGGFRVRTRTYQSGQSEPGYKDIGEVNTLVGLTPTLFLDYNFSKTFGVTLRPYYRYQLYDNDLQNVNKELNPNTYQNDNYEELHGTMLSGFGGELKAVFFF